MLLPSVRLPITAPLYVLATLAFVVLFIPQPGESIKCYDCNSHNDSRCALEVPPEAFKKDCSEHIEGSKYTLCRKIVQSIEHEVNGLQPDSRVIRTCGWDSSSQVGRCYQRSGFGGRQEVCTCTTDLCNSAPGLLLRLPLLLAGALLAAQLPSLAH